MSEIVRYIGPYIWCQMPKQDRVIADKECDNKHSPRSSLDLFCPACGNAFAQKDRVVSSVLGPGEVLNQEDLKILSVYGIYDPLGQCFCVFDHRLGQLMDDRTLVTGSWNPTALSETIELFRTIFLAQIDLLRGKALQLDVRWGIVSYSVYSV